MQVKKVNMNKRWAFYNNMKNNDMAIFKKKWNVIDANSWNEQWEYDI